MTLPPRRRTGLLALSGVLVLVLIAAGAYWTVVRAEDGPDTEAEAPVGERHRIMLAGDSMTQGANGDRTWRYHLWNHLSPKVEGLDFVGPYTDPASRDMIFPVPTEEGEEVPSPGGDPAQTRPGEEPTAHGPDSGGPVPPEEQEGAQWPGGDGAPGDAEYRDPEFDQQHNALWGRTLRDAASTIQEEVRVHEPDVLCAMLGVNDLLWPVSMEEMEYRLRRYVESARRANPDLRVVLAEAPPIALADSDEGFALRLYAYNTLVRELAEDMSTEQSPVVSLDVAGREVWDVSGDTYDGTHPNDGGEVKIAAAFADVLAEEYGIGEAYPRPLPSAPESDGE